MIGREAGKSYAYLLGVYLGDGCVTHHTSGKLVFKLNTIDEDFALATKAAIENLGGKTGLYKYEVSKSSKPNHALVCSDQDLCLRLRADTSNKTKLPLLEGEQAKQMIVGLMDSEGFVAEKTEHKTGRAYYMGFKSCDVWVPDFVKLLQSIGIRLGKVSECPPYRAHYKTPTRFHIKMQSWVDSGMRFNIKRKQDRVDRWARTVPYTERKVFPRRLTSETSTPEARKG